MWGSHAQITSFCDLPPSFLQLLQATKRYRLLQDLFSPVQQESHTLQQSSYPNLRFSQAHSQHKLLLLPADSTLGGAEYTVYLDQNTYTR